MYDDIQSFLEDLIESKTKARPSSSVRIAKQRIGYGEDPMVAAREFETYALGQGWKPKRVARGVRRIQDTAVTPIAAEKYTYAPTLVERTYRDLFGRAPTQSEIQSNIAYAGAKRVNPGDVGAFEALLNESLMSSREGMAKIKTPEDIEYERKYGPIPVVDGNLQRGMVVFRPDKVATINKQLREAAFSPIAGLNLSV